MTAFWAGSATSGGATSGAAKIGTGGAPVASPIAAPVPGEFGLGPRLTEPPGVVVPLD